MPFTRRAAREKSAASVVLLLAAALVCAAQARAEIDESVQISLPKEASQQQALDELHRKTRLLILSELPQVDHANPVAVEGAPWREALRGVTAAYYLHALVGTGRALFVRRFLDSKEDPDFPIEEMASISDGLDRLLDPLAPKLAAQGIDGTTEQGFLRSLTPAQIAAAQNGGLSLRDLSVTQRQVWHALNSMMAYDTNAQQMRRLAETFRNWQAAEGRWEIPGPDPRNAFALNHPARAPSGQSSELVFQGTPAGPPGDLTAKSDASTEDLPLPHAPITGCASRIGADAPAATVEEIVSRIATANQVTIHVPEWAKERRYLLFAEGHTGDEVLQALADINGWVIRSQGKGKFSLVRPTPAPASDYLNFYRKATRLFPPVLIQLFRDDEGGGLQLPPNATPKEQWRQVENQQSSGRVGQVRDARNAARLAEHVVALEKGYQPVPMRDLESDWQRLMANLIFHRLIRWIAPVMVRPPRLKFAAEDQGVFHIRGSLHLRIPNLRIPNGKEVISSPMIQFGVPVLSPDGKVQWDAWGFSAEAIQTVQ